MLQPGEQIDIWVIDRRLGSGGMGSVYACHNRNAARIRAAIKILNRPDSTDQHRFVREAEILYALDHPGVVKVRNVRLEHEPPYIEMAFVEGRALSEWVATGPSPTAQVLDVAQQLVRTVAWLHGRQVFHRDIKPPNIIADQQGRVTLVDFGLALEGGGRRVAQGNRLFGTVAYAPPEWVDPLRADPALWDIYSLGVTLHEMLTGKEAFKVPSHGNPLEIAVKVMREKRSGGPLDPGPDYPAVFRELIRGMTEPDEANRLLDLDAASRELEALARELPPRPLAFTAARPRSTWEPSSERGAEGRTTPPSIELPSTYQDVPMNLYGHAPAPKAPLPRAIPAGVLASAASAGKNSASAVSTPFPIDDVLDLQGVGRPLPPRARHLPPLPSLPPGPDQAAGGTNFILLVGALLASSAAAWWTYGMPGLERVSALLP